MNILLYLAAGNGDLINFTGILQIIKNNYVEYNIDFLILKKHYDIIKNNPCIRNIMFIDDFYDIPKHCTLDHHDDIIIKKFVNVKILKENKKYYK
jgi:ADP-heptose:LPS heptosyltransferase